MAKSARSSVRKRNNANLRATVFGPANDARTARLSAKLQELAAKPQPSKDNPMEIDEASGSHEEQADPQPDQAEGKLVHATDLSIMR